MVKVCKRRKQQTFAPLNTRSPNPPAQPTNQPTNRPKKRSSNKGRNKKENEVFGLYDGADAHSPSFPCLVLSLVSQRFHALPSSTMTSLLTSWRPVSFIVVCVASRKVKEEKKKRKKNFLLFFFFLLFLILLLLLLLLSFFPFSSLSKRS